MNKEELQNVLADLASMGPGDSFKYEITRAGEVEPWPEFEFLQGELDQNRFLKTRCHLVNEARTAIQGLGYRHAGTFTDIEGNHIADQENGRFFIGSVTAKNGRQFAFPSLPRQPYRLQGGENTWSIPSVGQMRGGAEHQNGRIYSGEFTANSKRVRWIDSNTLETGSIPFERAVGHYWRHVWGAVGCRGDVILLPAYGKRAGIVRRDDDTRAVEVGPEIPDWRPGVAFYTHGVYCPSIRGVVSLPREGTHVMIAGPVYDDFQFIEIPQELRDLFKVKSFSFDCELGPDGWVYSSPWGDAIIWRFHPLTQEFGWIDLREYLVPTREPGYDGQGFGTVATLIRNPLTELDEIHYGVGGGNRGFKLVFYEKGETK